MVDSFPDMAEILAEMNAKFIETAHEKITRLNEILEEFSKVTSVGSAETALFEEFYREIHSLKGMGGTFQMPVVTKLCHKMEDFFGGVKSLDNGFVENGYAFLDRLVELIESEDAKSVEKAADWLKGLPEKSNAPTQSVPDSGQSVLIVGKTQEMIEAIEPIFVENGFKVIKALSAFRAFKAAVQQKPDILVISQHLEDMDGAELMRSLGAMQQFSKAKTALVCPDRKAALSENLHGVHLLSENNISSDIMNFIAIAVTA